MFDTFVARPGDASHTHTHHEHRAPTDQSVALLREMERAALDKVIQAVRVENCGIDAVLHHMRDVKSGDDEFRIVYKINGARRVVDHRGNLMDDLEQLVAGLCDALARDVATVLMGGMLKAAGKLTPLLR
jgi:hypothetical protein